MADYYELREEGLEFGHACKHVFYETEVDVIELYGCMARLYFL